jgi:dihydrofolate reductase
MRPELVLIAAVARNGVIGDGNTLLWRLPEDMRFLRDTTMGHPVIMGRRTWQSLPDRVRPLPGRRNIVVSRDPAFVAAGAELAPSLDAALARVADAPRAYVLGGAQLYAQALPLADRLLLTELDRDFDGPIRFPDWPRDQFAETWRTHHDSGQGFGYQRADYHRKQHGT